MKPRLYDISLYVKLLNYAPDYNSYLIDPDDKNDYWDHFLFVHTDSIDDFHKMKAENGFYCDLQKLKIILEKLFISGKFLFFYSLLNNIKIQDPEFANNINEEYQIELSCKCDDPFTIDDSCNIEYLTLNKTIISFFSSNHTLFDFLCLIIKNNYNIDFSITNRKEFRANLIEFFKLIKRINDDNQILLMVIMQIVQLKYESEKTNNVEIATDNYFMFLDLCINSFMFNPYNLITKTFVFSIEKVFSIYLNYLRSNKYVKKTEVYDGLLSYLMSPNYSDFEVTPIEELSATDINIKGESYSELKKVFAMDVINLTSFINYEFLEFYYKYKDKLDKNIDKYFYAESSMKIAYKVIEADESLRTPITNFFYQKIEKQVVAFENENKTYVIKLMFFMGVLQNMYYNKHLTVDEMNQITLIYKWAHKMIPIEIDNTDYFWTSTIYLGNLYKSNSDDLNKSLNTYDIIYLINEFINNIKDKFNLERLLNIFYVDTEDIYKYFSWVNNDEKLNQEYYSNTKSKTDLSETVLKNLVKAYVIRLRALDLSNTQDPIYGQYRVNSYDSTIFSPDYVYRFYKMKYLDELINEKKINAILEMKLKTLESELVSKYKGKYDYEIEISSFYEEISNIDIIRFKDKTNVNNIKLICDFLGTKANEISKLFAFSYYLSQKYIYGNTFHTADIDYTTIITGYIKGIEQLIALIIDKSVNIYDIDIKIYNFNRTKMINIRHSNWIEQVSISVLAEYYFNNILSLVQDIDFNDRFIIEVKDLIHRWIRKVRNSKFHQSNSFFIEGESGIKNEIYMSYKIISHLFDVAIFLYLDKYK